MVEGTLRLAPLFLIEWFVPEQHQDDKAIISQIGNSARKRGAARHSITHLTKNRLSTTWGLWTHGLTRYDFDKTSDRKGRRGRGHRKRRLWGRTVEFQNAVTITSGYVYSPKTHYSKDVSTVTDMSFFAEPDGASAGAVRAHMMEGEHGNEDPPAFPVSYPEPTSTLKVNGDTP